MRVLSLIHLTAAGSYLSDKLASLTVFVQLQESDEVGGCWVFVGFL